MRFITLFFILIFSVPTYAEKNAEITLGRYLFNDLRLSKLGNRSCALCHAPDLAWTNRFAKVPDIHGNPTTLNTPSLLNSASFTVFMQRQPSLTSLEQTIMLPLFSLHPEEMGMTDNLLVSRLQQADDIYAPLFSASFGNAEITTAKVISALSEYVSSISNLDTPYHRYLNGDSQALNQQQKAGLKLFNSKRLKCSQCHSGTLLNQEQQTQKTGYFNTGLYGVTNSHGKVQYPKIEQGLKRLSHNENDDGKFRTPSLINVANTGPWGHDGSFTDLSSVVESYAAGGRVTTIGKNKGDGRFHPNKDSRISGFELNIEEKAALLAFLTALSTPDMSKQIEHQTPFCQLIPLKNKKDPKNCIPAYKYQP